MLIWETQAMKIQIRVGKCLNFILFSILDCRKKANLTTDYLPISVIRFQRLDSDWPNILASLFEICKQYSLTKI